jgi:methane/ammonia monooxygenase subunit B
MNVLVPGARFVKEEVWVNGKFVPTSFQLEKGADYEYKILIRARREGTYHVHPLVNLKGLGAVGGPGRFVDVSEGETGFTNPTKLAASGKIIDLERYGLSYVLRWWFVWTALGLGWLLYWISRRTLIRSGALVSAKDEETLITPFHRKLGIGALVLVLVVIAASYKFTSDRFSPLVPLQAGSIRVDALEEPRTVEVAFAGGKYNGAKRLVVLELDVTNRGETPLALGEFSTATVRFVNEDVKFVKESLLESSSGKGISVQGEMKPFSVEPGEKERLKLSIVSELWDTENLTSLEKTTESAFGGLLHFYDPAGERQIVAASGIVIPEFRS